MTELGISMLNKLEQPLKALQSIILRLLAVGSLRTIVSNRTHHFLADRLLVLIEIDAVAVTLTHLARAVQSWDFDGVVAEVDTGNLSQLSYKQNVLQ